MEITKELLEERIKNLETQKEQTIAQVNAIEGGILTVRGLLSDLKRENTKKKKSQKKGSRK